MKRYIYTVDENCAPIGIELNRVMLDRIKKIQEDFKNLEKYVHDEELYCIKYIKDFFNLSKARIWLKISENETILESSIGGYGSQITTNFKNIMMIPEIYFSKEFLVCFKGEKNNLELISDVLNKMPVKQAKWLKESLYG